MRCAHERVRRVPLGAVRQVPGPQGGGRMGVRVGNRKQRWSALCPHWLIDIGESQPIPTSVRGCHHSYHLSQSEKHQLKGHHRWMLQPMCIPQSPASN